ncbi:MAG: cytochrome-c oxidase, cbb3-type subunit II [Micavibrio aeruginosavorus]|uniref:Cytochrome-c oxidase, cbb3-type subunit II n=1 Tax=Micavibrio aeruginosavorus TaxID=349221 RepID=A0A7T5R1G3_9BACT|nr:MAG: cytochrome-c oxidase, cbb3-type subunit II [Micavibrio aeruginosavorus]
MSFLYKHQKLERNSVILLVCIIGAILVGGIVEIIPLFRQETVIEPVKGVRPYTPLELAGYNIYIREGCYVCHSQQIRPLRDEVARYGHYSLAAESMYDHPFQWGSKRTGPDLARVGGKYSDEWHTAHIKDPRNVVPESVMPSYSFLANRGARLHDIDKHLRAQRALGVPYTDDMIKNAESDAASQAHTGSDNQSAMEERYGTSLNVRDFDGNPMLVSEMDALIAYLQVLGTMVKFTDYEPNTSTAKAGEKE